MEEVSLRFPHIIEQIFKKMKSIDLAKCRIVSNSWKNMIDVQKEIWIRMIQVIQNDTKNSKSAVDNFVQKKNAEGLIEEAAQMTKIYTKASCEWSPINLLMAPSKYEKLNSPLHIAAENGYLKICQFIIVNVKEKNPENLSGYTPLHKAAKNGHSEVCEFILANVEEKNPKCNFGTTPLHWAAKNGLLVVCRIILENVIDKNPSDKLGRTPLHYAATNGNSKICHLFLEIIQEKNPRGHSKTDST